MDSGLNLLMNRQADLKKERKKERKNGGQIGR
jgi:hypothetical protein